MLIKLFRLCIISYREYTYLWMVHEQRMQMSKELDAARRMIADLQAERKV